MLKKAISHRIATSLSLSIRIERRCHDGPYVHEEGSTLSRSSCSTPQYEIAVLLGGGGSPKPSEVGAIPTTAARRLDENNALPSSGTRQPTMSSHDVMNYKRKKRHITKIVKRKELHASSICGWRYPGRIAREISMRNEFKKDDHLLA